MVKVKNDDNKAIWVGANPVTSNLYFNNIHKYFIKFNITNMQYINSIY